MVTAVTIYMSHIITEKKMDQILLSLTFEHKVNIEKKNHRLEETITKIHAIYSRITI